MILKYTKDEMFSNLTNNCSQIIAIILGDNIMFYVTTSV